jgi:alanyl aminopeptidase
VLASLLLAAASIASSARPAAEAIPLGKLPDAVVPLHYALHLTVDPRQERFSGETRIRVRLAKPTDRIWLHAQHLDIASASATAANGTRFDASARVHDDVGVLELKFARRLPAQEIELALTYSAAFNAQLEGLYKVKVGDDSYAVTQMEPVSARYAFPGFDEPRFKTPFDVSLTVPKAEVAIANTLQKSESTSTDGQWKTLSFATTQPLPTYLIAFAVGPWDVVDAAPIPPDAVRNRPIPLRGIGPRGSAKRLAWVLEQTPAIVKFYEDYTAQPYPFDKLDLLGAPDFSAGAMENAGLIVYRDAYLLLDEHSAADSYREVFNTHAHEVAHQWYGDLVTVPWWDDIWLNEAYATWAQAKATIALHPEYYGGLEALEAHLSAMHDDSLLSARKVRQPIFGRGDIETAFDDITYQKGAAILGMFEGWLGEDVFRHAMRSYLARHAFGSGSADDLIAAIAEVSGKGDALAKAMHSFLDQPGVPLIRSELACTDAKATITLTQSRYLPYGVLGKDAPRWGVPVCARFAGAGTQCFLLTQPTQTFAVEGSCPAWYLPNADARGYYRYELASADMHALGAAVGQLSPAEQLVYADALASAFRRGGISAASVLDAMPQLADSPLPQVATALLPTFLWIREQLGDARTRPLLDAYAIRLYEPRLRPLGLRRKSDEAGTQTALRTRLAQFLGLDVRDAATRAALAQQGRAAIGLDGAGKADLTRADADLLGIVLKVAVQDGDASVFDAVQREFASNRDTAQRYALLAALGATRDPALGARARDFGIEAQVQIGEMSRLYRAQMEEPDNRAALWQWLQDHYEAYRMRLPAFAQSEMPQSVAEGRCSNAAADELSNFFTPRIATLIGGERGLGQTLEEIRQCASLREHIGPKGLAGWDEAQAGKP